MAGLSESLRSACIGADVEVGYELSKMLRKFEVQLQCKGVHSLMPDLGRFLVGGLATALLWIPPEV